MHVSAWQAASSLWNTSLCRHEEALADYTAALHMQPSNPEALWHRGNLQAALGRPQAALEDFSRAIAQDRSAAACFDARCLMGLLHMY